MADGLDPADRLCDGALDLVEERCGKRRGAFRDLIDAAQPSPGGAADLCECCQEFVDPRRGPLRVLDQRRELRQGAIRIADHHDGLAQKSDRHETHGE